MKQQDYNKKHRHTEKSESTNTVQNTWFFKPLILAGIILILDQITKLIVLLRIPKLHSAPDDIVRVLGDFLWFINISNRGAMFSIGVNFSSTLRLLMLFILPIILLLYISKIMLYSSWHRNLRWIAGGIIGGGMGNMIDRIFRADGVVDFISVNIYGLFNMNRWPTFNIADSAIVISMIAWIICVFLPSAHSFQPQTKNNLENNNSKPAKQNNIDAETSTTST